MTINAMTKQIKSVCTLEEALAFQSSPVIERFMKHFDVTEEQARGFFEDVKQWLWLAGLMTEQRKANIENVPERLTIDPQMLIVDEMWHNFICFTKVYQNYCESHFGKMVHHYPTTNTDKSDIREKLMIDPEYQRSRKRVQYNYIYDKLGKDTFNRWYFEYPKVYTPEKILVLRKA